MERRKGKGGEPWLLCVPSRAMPSGEQGRILKVRFKAYIICASFLDESEEVSLLSWAYFWKHRCSFYTCRYSFLPCVQLKFAFRILDSSFMPSHGFLCLPAPACTF